jgi:glycosyltransferase involved in cell wall biosynthesis
MRIAIDARELAGRPTGVGRYLGELLGEWSHSAEAGRHEWTLYSHADLNRQQPHPGTVVVLPGSGGTRWEQWTLARELARQRPDLLFAPGYTAPFTAPCPVALTIHDVSFAAHPEWFSSREGLRRRTITAWSARRARVVLTDSRFSRDEIVRHVGIPAAKIKVIPLGVPGVAVNRSTITPRQPLVLYVGSLFGRRHVHELIRAFVEQVAGRVPGSRLEVVGENRYYPADDASQALKGVAPEIAARVALRSYLPDEVLKDLYTRASVFAFLSEYEGFGLPPLEALAAGVPSVVLDTPVAREIYGPAAEYVDRLAPEVVGGALVDLLTRPEKRAALLQHRDTVLAHYSWPRAADATLHALLEAGGA